MDTKSFMGKTMNKKGSILDKHYTKHINNVVNGLDEEEETRWETYGVIIQELLENNSLDTFEEIKYRLTDNENPNSVFLDIINRNLDDVNNILWLLKKRLEDFIEDDSYRRFYI